MAAARARKRAVAGVGRILGWPGGSLWIGRHLGPVQDHAHHAIQISLAMEGRFQVQASSWAAPREAHGMVVMPDRRHRFDGSGAMAATIFVEPNSARGAALQARFRKAQVSLLPAAEVRDAVKSLHAQYRAGAADAVLAQFSLGVVCRLAGNPPAQAAADPRIARALSWMRQRLGDPIRLEEAAAVVHLSPGRFRHLFVSQTGTSMRSWLLWARIDRAVTLAFQGRSWTDAAHQNGFADAAHLTRTCRRVFGIAPTMLVPEAPSENSRG